MKAEILAKIAELQALAEQLPDDQPIPEPIPTGGYRHLLDPVTLLQPAYVDALGRRWSSATASEVRPNMPHCCQVDEKLRCLKFVLRDTPDDLSPDGRPRAEISTVETQEHQAHNGVKQWNSYVFRMPKWSDPAAMASAIGSSALSINQLKPNSGGSPTRCHRLTKDAFFRATKTAPGGTNVKLYTGNKRLDDGLPHRIVEAVTPHPTSGKWEMWLDGVKIVNFTGPIGADTGGYSPSFGIYASSGIGCDIEIEYHVEGLLSAAPLSHLVTAPLVWPA